jgi:hypothetical protein
MPRRLIQGIATAGSGGGTGSLSIIGNTISSQVLNDNVTFSAAGTGELVVPTRLLAQNTTQSNNKDTGSVVTEGGVGIAQNLFIGGYFASTGGLSNTPVGTTSPNTGSFTDITVTSNAVLAETSNIVANKSSATGTVIHDFTESNNWLHSSISANFTANFTNVPTTDDRMYTFILYLQQGATGYIASAVQINGISQNLLWSGSTIPRPGTSSFDVQTFTVIRSGGQYRIFVSLSVNATTSYPGSSSSNPAPSGFWLSNNLRTPLSLPSGFYWIQSPTMPNALQMYVDMVQEGGGYDFFPITGGISTNLYGNNHSGHALGLDIVYPRSPQHWQAMRNYVTNVRGDTGNAFFQTCYAVYRMPGSTGGSRGGNYTSVIMRDPRFYGSGTEDWRTGDGGRWWLRNTTFGEPNGDYPARGYLGLAAGGYTFVGYSGGDISFNDITAGYALGGSYLVSTNAKP